MFGGWDLFNVLDETQKLSISLGNDKEIKVEDVGTVVLDIQDGKTKLLHEVQFFPGLVHNLLSVG